MSIEQPAKALDVKKSIIAAWASFDFAHSSFSGIMVTFVFPIYYTNVIVTNGHGDLYWSTTLSISMLLVALISPLLGAMADIRKNKKFYLAAFTAITILCTAASSMLMPGMVIAASVIMILANFGFEGGTVFYDAFLPEITSEKTFGRVSGYGFAAGYLGSLLILALPLMGVAPAPTFIITAIFFFVFAVPLFLYVPEQRSKAKASLSEVASHGFEELRQTFGRIRQYKNVFRFLVAFFFYNDALLTVKMFSGLFAKGTLHFTTMELAIFFAMIQIVALMGAIGFGMISDKFGPKISIVTSLYMLLLVVAAAYFTESKEMFYVVGALAGIAIGALGSSSRTLMARLTPIAHNAEFFGFYDGFCGKASAVICPLIFGVLSDLLGSQRPAILAIGAFFIVGIILMRKVDQNENRQVTVADNLLIPAI